MAKTTQRIKSNTLLIPIVNWEEADQIVRRIGQLQNDIALCELACAEKIDAAKRALQNDTQPLHEKLDLHLKSLEAFCAANRTSFGKKQSKQLQFGVVGYRRSVALTVKKTTLDLIKRVFGAAAVGYLNIKETPDKDALAKLTDEQLAALDAARVEKETFYVEPDTIDAVNVESAKS